MSSLPSESLQIARCSEFELIGINEVATKASVCKRGKVLGHRICTTLCELDSGTTCRISERSTETRMQTIILIVHKMQVCIEKNC